MYSILVQCKYTCTYIVHRYIYMCSIHVCVHVHSTCIYVYVHNIIQYMYLYFIIVPPAPQNVTANHLNVSAMIIRWNRISIIDAKGHIQGYTVNYSLNARKRQTGSKTVGPDDDHTIVNGLQSGVRYSVYVTAATSIGTGGRSDVTVVELPEGMFMCVCVYITVQ